MTWNAVMTVCARAGQWQQAWDGFEDRSCQGSWNFHQFPIWGDQTRQIYGNLEWFVPNSALFRLVMSMTPACDWSKYLANDSRTTSRSLSRRSDVQLGIAVCMWFILFWEQSHRPTKLKLIDSKWPAGRGYVIVAWRYHHWINDPLAWFLHEMLLACLEQNPPFLALLTTMSANQLVCAPFHFIRTTLGGSFISLYFLQTNN